MLDESFFHVLSKRVKENPNKTAFIYLKNKDLVEEKVTYLELENKAKIIAAKLQTIAKKGDRVLLLYPPGLDFVYGYLGCLYAGVIAVPTYPPDPTRFRKTLPRLRSIIDSAKADIVLTTKQIYNISPVMFIISPGLRKLNWVVTDKLKQSLLSDWQKPNIKTDEVAFLQYTSGSTAEPKGVMVTHKNLIYNSEAIYNMAEHNEKSVYVCWVPNYHDMGLIGGILQPLYGNFLGVLMSPLTFLKSPITWIKAMSKYKGNTTPFPNFALDLCIKKIKDSDLDGIDLSNWELGCNGAETIRKESLDKFAEKFSKYGYKPKSMYPAYGLAEATLIVSGRKKWSGYQSINISKSSLENNLINIVSEVGQDSLTLVGCGSSIIGQKIKIVNSNTKKECKNNQVGEIWLSSPCIAKGYWNDPEKTKETFEAFISDTNEGPYLKTGDLGFLHNNELYVTGRIKDMLIIRGVNHYPQDIELTVQSLTTDYPAIRPGCTIACSVNVDNHEQLVIFQEIDKKRHKNSKSKEKYSPKKIVNAIRSKISTDHDVQVFGIFLIKNGTIPKTSSGKIMRHACKIFFESNFKKGSIKIIEKSLLNTNDLLTEIKYYEPEINQKITEDKVLSKTKNNNLDNDNKSFSEISKWLVKWLNEECMIPSNDIELEKNFNSYGLDSANSLIMIEELEKHINQKIDPAILWEFQNIKVLAEYLSGELPNSEKSEKLTSNNQKMTLTNKGSNSRNENEIEQFFDSSILEKKRIVFAFPETSFKINFSLMKKLYSKSDSFKKKLNYISNKYKEINPEVSITESIINETDNISNNLLVFTEQIIFSELLIEKGIVPNIVIGSGICEVSAAYISGSIDLIDAIKITSNFNQNNDLELIIKGSFSRIPFFSKTKEKILEGTLLNNDYWNKALLSQNNLSNSFNKLIKKKFNSFIEISFSKTFEEIINQESEKLGKNILFTNLDEEKL